LALDGLQARRLPLPIIRLDPHVTQRTGFRFVYTVLGNPCTLIELDPGYCEKIAAENGLQCNKQDWSCSS